jgi:hypothetical protein
MPSRLGALPAVPAQENFGDLTKFFAAWSPAGGQLKREFFEAGDLAAVDAHEMGMLELVPIG